MSNFLYLIRQGALFFSVKLAVLIAPFLAASILSKSVYGTVEWWLALSLVLGPLLGMGGSGLIAYGTLGGKLKVHINTSIIYTLLVVFMLISISIILPFIGLSWEDSLLGIVALLSALIMLQLVFSARLKGLGKGAWASLVESSLYFCLIGAVLLTVWGLNFVTSFMTLILFILFILIFSLSYFVKLPNINHWNNIDFIPFFKIGIRFMISGALIGFFMAAPRISLGLLATPIEVAELSIIFRWLSIPIAIHQFINTIFFKKLFGEVGLQHRDKMLALNIGLVFCGIVFVVTFLHLEHMLHIPIVLPIPSKLNLLLPMAVVILMWATSACLEGSLYRIDAIKPQIIAVAAGCVVQVTSIIILSIFEIELVQGAIYSWVLGFATIIACQFRYLYTLKIHLPFLMSISSSLIAIMILITPLGRLIL